MGGRLRSSAALLAGVACLFTFVATAGATSMLDFGVLAPNAGAISYSGGSGPLVGTGITVGSVTGLPGGTPLACTGCVLNFSTGGLSGYTANSWTFGGGDTTTITVTGAVPGAGISDSSTVLLEGQFGNVTVLSVAGAFQIAGAAFVDTKNQTLLDFFHLPGGVYNGNFNISFLANGLPPGGFSSFMVLSGDILNTPSAVPEPSTAMLLAPGLLLGLVYLARPRRSVSSSSIDPFGG